MTGVLAPSSDKEMKGADERVMVPEFPLGLLLTPVWLNMPSESSSLPHHPEIIHQPVSDIQGYRFFGRD
jgi:hypothetical protein